MRTGSRSFRLLPRASRTKAIQEVYNVIASTTGLTLFAAAVDKPAFKAKYHGKVDPYRGGFEGISTMFDLFLKRKQRQSTRVERGIVVFDEARPSLSKEIRRLLRNSKPEEHALQRWTALLKQLSSLTRVRRA